MISKNYIFTLNKKSYNTKILNRNTVDICILYETLVYKKNFIKLVFVSATLAVFVII